MKTNKDYMLREIAGEYVLVPTGAASQKLNGMIQLTETAAFLWKQVDTAENMQEIIERMVAEFEVEEETAARDTYGFLGELYMREMIQDVPELAAIAALMKEQEEKAEQR